MKTPKIDIVVTRHIALVEYLREVGITTADTPVIEHATAADVHNKHVVGVLPHHLSTLASSITEVPMRWTVEDRVAMQSGDLGIDRTRACAGDPITYVVMRLGHGGVDPSRPRWLAAAAAWAWVDAAGTHYGAGPGVVEYITDRTFRGLSVTCLGDGGSTVFAEMLTSRGVWRRHGRGCWVGGYGRVVPDDEIPPAIGWVADSAAE